MSTKQKLLDILLRIDSLVKNNKVTDVGICAYIRGLCKDNDADRKAMLGLFRLIARTWKYCLDDYEYLVPASRDNKDIDEAENTYWNINTAEEMWYEGEYAELRRELLAYVIKKLIEE